MQQLTNCIRESTSKTGFLGCIRLSMTFRCVQWILGSTKNKRPPGTCRNDQNDIIPKWNERCGLFCKVAHIIFRRMWQIRTRLADRRARPRGRRFVPAVAIASAASAFAIDNAKGFFWRDNSAKRFVPVHFNKKISQNVKMTCCSFLALLF